MAKKDKLKFYRDLKQKHPDATLLFRSRDLYISYDEDADRVAKVLNLTVSEAKGYKQTSFPYHALYHHLPLLIRAGYRCAICDLSKDIDPDVEPESEGLIVPPERKVCKTISLFIKK